MASDLRMLPTLGRAVSKTLSSDLLIFYGGRYCRLLRSEDCGELSPARDAELAVCGVKVTFDRPHRNDQALGNIGIGQTSACQGDDFLLPPGQHRQAGRLSHGWEERDLRARLADGETGGLGPRGFGRGHTTRGRPPPRRLSSGLG